MVDYKYLSPIRCQYGVYDKYNPDDNFCSDCGEPAVAKVWWGIDSLRNSLHVCREHLQQILEDEEKLEEEDG